MTGEVVEQQTCDFRTKLECTTGTERLWTFDWSGLLRIHMLVQGKGKLPSRDVTPDVIAITLQI